MDYLTLFVILLISILTVASCSIGIQCQNKAGDKTSTNHSYLVFILVVAIFSAVGSIVAGAYHHFHPEAGLLS